MISERINLRLFQLLLLALVVNSISCGATSSNIAPQSNKQTNDTSRLKLEPKADLPLSYKEARHLQFINDQYGWICNSKKLWRTADGGRNWDCVFSVNSQMDDIMAFEFVSPADGWLLSVQNLYKTKNSGESWETVANPMNGSEGSIYAIKILKDPKQIWIAGSIYRKKPANIDLTTRELAPDEKKAAERAIFYSENEGITWHQQPVIPAKWGGIGELFVLDSTHGWAVSDMLCFLEDGKWKKGAISGTTCRDEIPVKRLPGSDLADGLEPVSAFFLNNKLGWVCFRNGQLAQSSDGGKTWCVISHGEQNWPHLFAATHGQKLYFSDAQNGLWWIEYRLYATADCGMSWQKLSEDVVTFHVINPNQVLSITDGKLITIKDWVIK